MSSRYTRRHCALLLAAAPLAAQVTGPATPPAGSPVPPKAPATPEARREKAIADVREISKRLASIEVPMNLEPAFAFHV